MLAAQVGSASAAAPVGPRPLPAAPPTDRVVEQVSPVDKGGQPVDNVLWTTKDEGGGALFQSLGAFGDVQNTNGPTYYRARRGATGWETVGLQPRPVPGQPPSSMTMPAFIASGDQLDSLIQSSSYGFVAGAPTSLVGTDNIYRVGPQGAVGWLSAGMLTGSRVTFASADGQRVLLEGLGPAIRLVARDGDRSVDVAVGPDGTPLASAVSGDRTRPYSMSDDGQTVAFWSADGGGFPAAAGGLHVRRNALGTDATTAIADRSRRTGAPAGSTCGSSAEFLALSRDGRRLLLTCTTPLTDDAPASGLGLYEYDVVADTLRFRAAPGTGSAAVLRADADLERVYYRDNFDQNLKLLDGDQVREIVTGTAGDANQVSVAMSRDATKLAFLSAGGLDAGYGGTQLYLYDATAGSGGTVTCVSCRVGESSGGPASFGQNDANFGAPAPRMAGALWTTWSTDSFAADGTLYFTSPDELAPGAAVGKPNVYEYRDGQVRLLQSDAQFAGASPEGTDVFVLTRQALVPEDDDFPVTDLYSLRRGGGFPPDPDCGTCGAPAPEDRGGARPDAPIATQQAVPVARGERQTASVPVAKPVVVSRQARGTTARVRVRVRAAGTVRVSGSGVRAVSRRVSKAGTYTVTVRPSAYGRRVLERRGRLPLRLTVRLAPRSGAASQVRTTVTIKTTRKAG